MRFGIGIENETGFSFFDKDKEQIHTLVTDSKYDIKVPPRYGDPDSFAGGKWVRGEKSNATVVLDGDSTVAGTHGYGLEFAGAVPRSMDVRPKQLVQELVDAQNNFAKGAENDTAPRLKKVMKSPFGTFIGDTQGESTSNGHGSYHLNLTLPYDETKMESDADVTRNRDEVFNALKGMRLIQPLIHAMTGGADAKGIGQPNHAEGSGRQAYTSFTNFGNTSLSDTFRRVLDESTMEIERRQNAHRPFYKYDNRSPSFKKIMREHIPQSNVESGSVGDIVVKHYKNTHPNARTVELRFLDNFRTKELYPVSKVILSAMAQGKNVGNGLPDGKADKVWNEATASIMEEGWNAVLSKKYVKYLNKNLKLNIPEKDMRADMVFEHVQEQLWKQTKNDDWMKLMFKGDMTAPQVNNLNRDSWDAQFRYKVVNSPQFRDYIAQFLERLKAVDARKSNGWIRVYWKGDKASVRDLVLDSPEFGVEMGTEDTQDILYVLERLKAVELKQDSAGVITQVKVKYTDHNKVMDAIRAMPVHRNLYDTGITGPEEIGEDVALPTPQTARTPRQRQSVRSRTRVSSDTSSQVGNTNISMTTFETSEDAEFDRQDMQQIFNLSDFTNEDGARIRVNVRFRDVRIGRDPARTFWVRESPRQVTVYLGKEFAEVSDGSDEENILQRWIDMMEVQFFSNDSATRNTIFVTNLSQSEFFNRLRNTSRENYGKNIRPRRRNRTAQTTQRITLDRAGIERLKGMGVHIGSVGRGRAYGFVTRNNIQEVTKRFGERPTLLKNVPYHKKMYVEIKGNDLILRTENRVVDVLRGIQNGR